MIRKWNIVNDQSNANYDVGNEIIYHTEVLKSNLCDFNDTNILVTGDITIIGHQVTKIAFKSCAPLTKSTTKIDGTTIADAEGLDLLMSMSNLIKLFWNNRFIVLLKRWSKYFNNDIENTNDFKSFKYKAKLLGNTEADGNNE